MENIGEELNEFIFKYVESNAFDWERNEHIPDSVIEALGAYGYLGVIVPGEYGGTGLSCHQLGILSEEIGRFSVSLASLVNVQTMVIAAILRWGTDRQKKEWLPELSKGKLIGAIALTENSAGSDLQKIESMATKKGEGWVVTGEKKWITFGARADVLLVCCQSDEGPIAFVTRCDAPGITVEPIEDMLGFKAADLAKITFDELNIEQEQIIGKPGFALSHVVPYSLEFGRLCIAWTALGLLRGCMEICSRHIMDRETFGKKLIEHGQVQTFIAEMGTDLDASRHLCLAAACSKDNADVNAARNIISAKYFVSKLAAKHASRAIQILGALGCHESNGLACIYRDSKIMEIVEGNNQLLEAMIAVKYARKYCRALKKTKGGTNAE